MKKKDEIKADKRLKQLGVAPLIYHFKTSVTPFTAITIADDVFSRDSVRIRLEAILFTTLSLPPHEKAPRLRFELAQQNIYGVAICDGHDQFNRQRGRTIAKGRLWKHLKQERGK